MVLPATDMKDPLGLFRDNVAGLFDVRGLTRGNPVPRADNDTDEFDEDGHRKDPNRDRTVRRPKKRDSNAEVLAERSGQVIGYGTREDALIEAREAAESRAAERAASAGERSLFGGFLESTKSAFTSLYDTVYKAGSDFITGAKNMAYDYVINPISNAAAAGKQLFMDNIYNPAAQKLGALKDWGSQKLDQAGNAISNAFTSAKNTVSGWFTSNEPAQQQPQAAPQQQVAAKPDAAAQKLAGESNDVKSSLSLSSLYNGLSSVFGADDKPSTPAPTVTYSAGIGFNR